MEHDAKPPFHSALDHLAYSPLTSVSASASPASSPQRRPRSTWAAAPTSDNSRNQARSSDAQKANRPSRHGLRTRSKFFIEVPAPSFNLNKRKREEEKESKKRPRNGRSQKRKNRVGPEADADVDVDVDVRASPVALVERFLPEHVVEDLDVLFCGFNPGLASAASGHHYASPTNHFWPCLHLSGFTPIILPASEDYTLPEKYNLGLTNLLDNSTPSVSKLSPGEMAAAAPAVLTKVARFRPRVVCFIGKGIWVHVEPLLWLRTVDGGDNNDDQRDSGGPVARATESRVTLKEEEMDDSGMVCASSVVVNPDARPTKAEADLAGFSATLGPARLSTEAEGGDVFRRHLLAVQKAEETSDKTPPRSMTLRKRRGVAYVPRAPSKKAAARSAFAYGLQPYKAVHDKKANVRETLFCVFPSTSGRVVTHQRDDKVALFKTLRRDLERIRAGTFDTSSMQLVHLSSDVNE